MTCYCSRCHATFTPASNSQRYCSADCRRHAKNDFRRQRRQAFGRSGKLPDCAWYPTPEYPTFDEIDPEDRKHLVPDERWTDYECAKLTDNSWALDARALKSADRRSRGLPDEFDPALTYGFDRDDDGAVVVVALKKRA